MARVGHQGYWHGFLDAFLSAVPTSLNSRIEKLKTIYNSHGRNEVLPRFITTRSLDSNSIDCQQVPFHGHCTMLLLVIFWGAILGLASYWQWRAKVTVLEDCNTL